MSDEAIVASVGFPSIISRARVGPDKTAKLIIELICGDLRFKDKQNDEQYMLLNSKLKEENNGYFRVGLCKNNKVKFYLVHRLLAITFPELIDWTEEAKGKPIEKLQINHKNECKWDNNYWNLEWYTGDYNNSYGTKINKTINKLGKPVLQYPLNGDLICEFRSCGEAEKQTGISKTQINCCCF